MKTLYISVIVLTILAIIYLCGLLYDMVFCSNDKIDLIANLKDSLISFGCLISFAAIIMLIVHVFYNLSL